MIIMGVIKVNYDVQVIIGHRSVIDVISYTAHKNLRETEIQNVTASVRKADTYKN